MPWFLITIIFLAIMLNVRLRYLNQKHDAKYDTARYLEEDLQANFVRAKELDDDVVISLRENDLPFRQCYDESDSAENEIIRIQNKVRLRLKRPIIKTDLKNNTEVKKKYGAANLQAVIEGEENFTKLIQQLNRWAKLLIAEGNLNDAEAVLNAAVRARSDISETYILLYDIYTQTGRIGKIEELKGNIETLPDVARTRTEKYIERAEPRDI